MTCNEKCIHYSVCELKHYDVIKIYGCDYSEEESRTNFTSINTGTHYGFDTFIAEEIRGENND